MLTKLWLIVPNGRKARSQKTHKTPANMKEYRDGNYAVTNNGDGSITRPSKSSGPQRMVPSEPRPLGKFEADLVRKWGVDPADYFYCGAILRNAARPVIEAALREERDRRAASKLERKTKALAVLNIGHELCTCNYKNGDLCSGEYQAEDGTKILDSDLLEPLAGTEFFAIPTSMLNAKRSQNRAESQTQAATDKARQDEFAAKARQASETGKEVLLSSWTTHRCMNGNSDECSFDHASKFVLPDGSTKTSYSCCY